ncbi:PadR family transcriptional regulator [Bryobacter aggregatus]|uniref:PadR family transcriptional regulator n=1 Tax=Bryobacter aggregatus TaxID=360054 RepID=UPI0004E13564|nr:helix-turn-helix transcriptional regulator [Bryobacter aggregatus]
MSDQIFQHLPLAPASLHILLALSGDVLHGYGIMQEVARQSDNRYKLGPGTLYDNLQRLVAQGLVEEQAGQGGEEDSRRRYYGLSRLGREVLLAETDRLDGVVRAARQRLGVRAGRRSYVPQSL